MTAIEDFAKNLRQHSTPAATWRKIDLHNHSPESHDFVGDRKTALDDFAKEINAKRISVVMFTDHEKLPDPGFVSALSARTGALILAGLELNVFVDALGKPDDKVTKELCFHLLIGFDLDGAQSPQYWTDHLYRMCRRETRTFGNVTMTGVANTIDQISEILGSSGAFLIPAHLHSGPDAFRSRSVDVVYHDTEFLRWANTSFTALDVRNDKTAAYFDGKHAQTEMLEISCIRSSDAHQAIDVGTFPCWALMEKVSFAELKAALELPSRISRHEPSEPTSYIIGMHVEGQFLRDFWMTFSPHANVLIGVKGSGKTSVLECLRYCLGTEVPQERGGEVGKHLAAILGPAGRVQLLVRRDDGAKLLVERKVTERAFHLWFEDDRHVVSESPDALMFPAAILGWHEIEHAATDRQIRRLHMDAIAGREEVKRLTNDASLQAITIRRRHNTAAGQYNEYVQLRATVKEQEALRAGLQQLEDANLVELRDQMSNALADKEEIAQLKAHLESLPNEVQGRLGMVLQIDRFKFGDKSPLATITSEAKVLIDELKGSVSTYESSLKGLVATKAGRAADLLASATERFTAFSNDYGERLAKFSPEVQRLLESHREVLEKTRELPNLTARLSELKGQIESSLSELATVCETVAATLDERLQLRIKKIEEFNEMLADAGVTLAVIPGASREDDFSTTFNEHGQAKEAFQQLRAKHSAPARFHRILAKSYRELRDDLVSGDRVVFDRTDFAYLVTVLENDDLAIRFAVGKPGEPYSPIDQLSAGQRCTAVFPILLKLKDGPLVVDQPEDNLDNRHIARSVAPVLMDDKRARQIIMTSHNANLVVLSDPESIVIFEAENGIGAVAAAGFLSMRASTVTSFVLDILDGGEKALELRSKKYGRVAKA